MKILIVEANGTHLGVHCANVIERDEDGSVDRMRVFPSVLLSSQ